MGKTNSVKARKRTGTTSLDLTVPAELATKYQISPGDVFIVTAHDDGRLLLKYERVYPERRISNTKQ
jgi:bifunctional DNA-binding transcriptional regulator/antitoxin component of YhaV-PrlF toxin-antitoxin module